MRSVQILIATMFRRDLSFLNKMNVSNGYVVVNQSDLQKFPSIDKYDKERNHIVITNEERGLSKSRNIAIENATGDICLIADDDIVFVDGFINKILNFYEMCKDADVIVYDYSTNDSSRKCKSLGNTPRKLNLIDLLKVSSVRISFKRDSILKNNIKFNLLFGAGSVFPSGEENLFLKECYKKGLKVYYFPTVICNVDFEDSTWFNGFNEKYFEGKGALSYVFWGRLSFLYNLYFVYTKRKLYKNNLSVVSAFRSMQIGRRKYQELING